jgi:hypothetical protein
MILVPLFDLKFLRNSPRAARERRGWRHQVTPRRTKNTNITIAACPAASVEIARTPAKW